MQVILAQPRGFCAGVVRAIEIVDRALIKHGTPVFVRHEIVHNKHVVEGLRRKGARFVEELDAVPAGAVAIFSAHGVSRDVEEEAKVRELHAIDATCPLVITLSVDDTRGIIAALSRRFSDLVGPDTRDICYATQNRQSAVRELSKHVDVILVIGATNSSNSNRLREIGTESGVPSYLIADGSELDPAWVQDAGIVGITAGASAPEAMVEDVLAALRRLGPVDVSTMAGREEHAEFRLPPELADVTANTPAAG